MTTEEKVIEISNLSKQYEVQSIVGNNHVGFIGKALPFFKKRKTSLKTFFALSHINISVTKGDIFGIIGPNGSGKSTLLKLICGITKPTEGEIHINGKTIAVLELGIGFIKELSGRENIYHAASLFGLLKQEIDVIFNDIVNFSGLHDFIEMPVKHYSNGMFARLAFSVIAHINADIYLFDEVLAVGDFEFRTKALDKIKKLASEKKTILLVSHNINEIGDVCRSAILLNKGSIIAKGTPVEVSNVLMDNMFSSNSSLQGNSKKMEWPEISKAPGNDIIKLLRIMVLAKNKTYEDSITSKDVIVVEIAGKIIFNKATVRISYTLNDNSGHPLFTDLKDLDFNSFKDNDFVSCKSHIPSDFLNPGNYSIDIYILHIEKDVEKIICCIPKVIFFKIDDTDNIKKNILKKIGAVQSNFEWHISSFIN